MDEPDKKICCPVAVLIIIVIIILVLFLEPLIWQETTLEGKIHKEANNSVNKLEDKYSEIDPSFPIIGIDREDVKYNKEDKSVKITITSAGSLLYYVMEEFADAAANGVFDAISESDLKSIEIWVSTPDAYKVFNYEVGF